MGQKCSEGSFWKASSHAVPKPCHPDVTAHPEHHMQSVAARRVSHTD